MAKKRMLFWLCDPDKLLKTNNIKVFLRKTNPSEPEKLLKTQGFMAKSASIAAIYVKTKRIISRLPKTKPELPHKRTQEFRTVPRREPVMPRRVCLDLQMAAQRLYGLKH